MKFAEEIKNLTSKSNQLKAIILAIFCLFLTYMIGNAANNGALFISEIGVKFPTRDILAFTLIGFAFYSLKPYFISDISQPKQFFAIFYGFVLIAILLIFSWLALIFIGKINIETITTKKDYVSIILGGFLLIFHGAAEQILLQTIVRPNFETYFDKKTAIIFCGLSFAILQFLQGFNAPIYFINSLLIGMIFTILAQNFGFLCAIFAHATWSWLELIILPQFIKAKIHENSWFYQGQDSYGTVVFTIFGLCLLILLSQIKTFSYKNEHDKK